MTQPVFSVGDSWTFERRLSAAGIYRQTVLSVNGNLIELENVVDGKARRPWSVTSEFNRIFNADDKHAVERWVSFPMRIGSTWDSEYSRARGQSEEFSATVKERGVCATRAGSFDALRVEASGHWFNQKFLPAIADGRSELDYWYAPQVGRVVLFKGRHWRKKGVGSVISREDYWELLEFKRKSA